MPTAKEPHLVVMFILGACDRDGGESFVTEPGTRFEVEPGEVFTIVLASGDFDDVGLKVAAFEPNLPVAGGLGPWSPASLGETIET